MFNNIILLNMMVSIKLSPEQESAMKKLLSGKPVFLTGKAGSGKSTLINEFKQRAKGSWIVVAPTGKAALNVDGATIHTQMSIPTGITPFKTDQRRLDGIAKDKKDLLANIEIIIVDEVSMVRADLLEAMDQRMKHAKGNKLPFGGVQMIFVGDFYQLPPVVIGDEKNQLNNKIFAFQSKSWDALKPLFIELDNVHRQKDGSFLDALNKIRVGDKTAINEINKYVRPQQDDAVGITFTNKNAAEINDKMLASLPGPTKNFSAKLSGQPVSGIAVAEKLALKVGAQIITVVNNVDAGYVNGSVGTVVKLDKDSVFARFGKDPKIIELKQHVWDNMTWVKNKKGQIVLKSSGKFTQFPVMLAWAMTSHKLQGESLDVGHLTRGNGAFAHGQTYVALSRLRSENGLSLETPIESRDIIVDRSVLNFMEEMRGLNPLSTLINNQKIELEVNPLIEHYKHLKNQPITQTVDKVIGLPEVNSSEKLDLKFMVNIMKEMAMEMKLLKEELNSLKAELRNTHYKIKF